MNDRPSDSAAAAPQPSVSSVSCLGRPAPDFEARSSQGPLRLSDYRGRWLVFFSHPADFTPVCTSEFIAFAKAEAEFAARGCALLGLSVDSVYAHLAWLRDIEDRFGIRIGFPLVEDISMAVARAYGMIDAQSDSTATVRAVFVIDPAGIIRAAIQYPMNVGRSAAEILRVLAALQEADQSGVATPEGWRPGAPAVRLPPASMAEIGPVDADAAWYYRPANGGGDDA